MTLWGGTINAVGYDLHGQPHRFAGKARIYVTFTTGPGTQGATHKAVLAYGANIAGDGYWGVGEGAQAIYGNGSPYHRRVRGIRQGTWLAVCHQRADVYRRWLSRPLPEAGCYLPNSCLQHYGARLCLLRYFQCLYCSFI